MYTEKQMLYIKALTPIHAGAGQSLTSVDMPIQRERHSNIPKIEASGLKGAIKHMVYQKLELNSKKGTDEEKKFETVFGPEKGDEFASAIAFTDARLLLFPMRSITGIYRLITCPYVLKRWIEDCKMSKKDDELTEIEEIIRNMNIDEGQCLPLLEEDKIILEEYIFEATAESNAIKIKEALEKLDIKDIEKIVVLSDSDFIDMVSMYTEIITRNKIDVTTGAAENTGLFTEEYLPTETVLYFSVLAAPSFDKKDDNDNIKTAKHVMKYFKKQLKDKIFQVGGNATLGKGFVKILGGENWDE